MISELTAQNVHTMDRLMISIRYLMMVPRKSPTSQAMDLGFRIQASLVLTRIEYV